MVPDSILWIVLGALCGWLGKAQLERFKVTEAYRTQQAARRVDAQVEVWRRLDLSLFQTSYYLEAIIGYKSGDDASRERLNARAMKAKEVHENFEIALHERRMVLGEDFRRFVAIHNRVVALDELAMQRPVNIDSMKAEVEAIERARDDLATIVKRSLQW